jgi:hypothetical protein
MAAANSNSNELIDHILTNSLFTQRQFAIISKRLHSKGKAGNISSGAYYRQVSQCREKIIAVIYSAILLQSTGVLQSDALTTSGRLAEQLAVIFDSQNSDIPSSRQKLNDVMSVMDELVKRMSKL